MGILFSFIFLTFLSFSFIFFETEKAVHGRGVHSGECLGQVTNGAPWHGAPLLIELVMAHHSHGAPLVVLKKLKKNY